MIPRCVRRPPSVLNAQDEPPDGAENALLGQHRQAREEAGHTPHRAGLAPDSPRTGKGTAPVRCFCQALRAFRPVCLALQ